MLVRCSLFAVVCVLFVLRCLSLTCYSFVVSGGCSFFVVCRLFVVCGLLRVVVCLPF